MCRGLLCYFCQGKASEGNRVPPVLRSLVLCGWFGAGVMRQRKQKRKRRKWKRDREIEEREKKSGGEPNKKRERKERDVGQYTPFLIYLMHTSGVN